MQFNDKKESQKFIIENYREIYENVLREISKRKSSRLIEKLVDYYLNSFLINNDEQFVIKVSDELTSYLKEINVDEINYYIEYCIELHPEMFEKYIMIIYAICKKTNRLLEEFESNDIYLDENKRREAINNLYKHFPIFEDKTLDESINNIIYIEEKLLKKEYIKN